MVEYGVWLKGDDEDILVHTNNMMGCQRYTEIETAKNSDLKTRWRIGPLPRYRVMVKTKGGEEIVAAFEEETTAMFYAREFLEKIDSKTGEEVVIVS
ncbi:hypothetical protein CFBP4996_15420 [Agrobacterium leguminum]|uniref:Uncharacterized protein n=1 Tax=Agrobacterium deltaense NCPPB 1641 TaxID=1183425 RepID=A0A1S7U2K5_9HYPH|nr:MULTISPECIES: hypothetical protein [Agrobacterium]WFS67417.1 hypothetical protein CFBP4996_15420 [Agrobacterium leguminum]CVI60991.1 hypothetical protein AGR7A_Lc140049 [Agrobacterium deltaense NCPPB 1641]